MIEHILFQNAFSAVTAKSYLQNKNKPQGLFPVQSKSTKINKEVDVNASHTKKVLYNDGPPSTLECK